VTRRKGALVALAVVCTYLAAAVATVLLRGDHVRPLYDGFVPPSSYHFVDPPSFFAAGNVQPQPLSATIELGPGGSKAAGIATPDGQFVIDLAAGAISPSSGDTSVAVHITPLAPSQVPAVPQGLRANGNAYRVDMTYAPSGQPVRAIAVPGTLLVEIPELGNHLFLSSDADTWTAVASQVLPPRQLSLTASFAAPGTYLAATSLPELAAPSSSSHSAIVLGIVVAVLALVLFAAAFFFVRRRRPRRPGEAA
jgi:hypothetical protein